MRHGLGKGKCADFQGFFSKRRLDLRCLRVLAEASGMRWFQGDFRMPDLTKIAAGHAGGLLDPASPLRIIRFLTDHRHPPLPGEDLVALRRVPVVEEVRGDGVPPV